MKTTKTNEEMVIEKDFEGLYKKNRPFIKLIANKYKPFGDVHFKDLIQVGRIGLYIAMNRYQPNHKSNFLSYSRFWIKKEMVDYLNNNLRTVRIPVNIIVDKERERLPVENMLSLDQPINDEDASELYSTIPYNSSNIYEDDDADDELKRLLRTYLPKLNHRHQTILKMVYNEEKSLAEIAKELGKTKQAIWEQHQTALSKIRKFFGIK